MKTVQREDAILLQQTQKLQHKPRIGRQLQLMSLHSNMCNLHEHILNKF